jgi:hypothetical protein
MRQILPRLLGNNCRRPECFAYQIVRSAEILQRTFSERASQKKVSHF